MRYAVINKETNKVVNVIIGFIDLGVNLELVELSEDSPVSTGWSYVNKSFVEGE
jgi:hypothetical protein